MSTVVTLDTPLANIPGVGKTIASRFSRLGVESVGDLFGLLPFRLEDRTNIRNIAELPFNEEAVIAGRLTKIHSRNSKRGVFVIQATVEDQTGKIAAVWFNQRYLLKLLREGQHILLYGSRRHSPSMGNPFFVKKIIPRLEVTPIYPTTSGLSQYTISRTLEKVKSALTQVKDVVPSELAYAYQLPNRASALEAAHFSPTEEAIAQARRLLSFEELLIVCLEAISAKRQRVRISRASIESKPQTVDRIKELLQFQLTSGQEQALEEILTDLSKPYPMNRLLYGEVGSGKTAVGLILAALVALAGERVVWLSPTTTLAHQQAEITKKFFAALGIPVAQITGAKKDDQRQAKVLVGTHALLYTKSKLESIGLLIIDEQHRFGVQQRNQLLTDNPTTHLLMMTATPIPRSLAHTVFGHIDITLMAGKPIHQKPVQTFVFTDEQREKVEEHIRERLKRQHPGYIICPLIEPGESTPLTLFQAERKAVTTELERLVGVFPQARIGLLHGRLKSQEKETVLTNFKSGQLDILLATSVVEVGIDNPAASWILIEEADRFGLSQLHQLRGRVGRGERNSVCFLHNSLSSERAKERLTILKSSDNGLEIAEKDLQLRGPGDIAGEEQSGLLNLRYASLGDVEAIRQAYAAAQQLIDKGLANYPILKAELTKRERYNHGQTAT